METYIGEYSYKQKCFHIQLLSEACEKNLMAFERRGGEDNQWVPLCYGTHEEVSEKCKTLSL